ncbi:golgin subfamily A member 6-like protein 1 isoform X1 [Electrophorus electricus]|uniref:golgin subfamily A member 6-like protein 1 isoform X1 n=2 Tax=Electrophorus electricus TaxID=8005 RepID=UPI0015CFCA91|nr:golgin subfamily A member 6-like protein 1 isoform X1 [Electrophorus electricus]
MDGSSLSSLSEEESSAKQHSLPTETNEQKTSLDSGPVEDLAKGERLLSGEEQLTLITESMSVTTADEEKLLLLNRNTELRRLNKELMKLNEDWDHIYRSTSEGLQQQVTTLEQETSDLKQLNSRLLLKVEHEQNKREYYEHTLMQELKKNQHLQEYIRLLESRLHHTDALKHWSTGTENTSALTRPLDEQLMERNPKMQVGLASTPGLSVSAGPPLESRQRNRSSRGIPESCESQAENVKEVQDLKEQLEALRCQTKIYEADYKIEHKDHERMLQENKRLRRREGEMRQQMSLLQEQLKVYEDDFQKERSDKQLLQRLLMRKTPGTKEPVLVHRCNNDQERVRGEWQKNREEEERRAVCVCPKHCKHHRQLEYP